MPLYKKGDKTSAVNYRPISILSKVGKSMEMVMCNISIYMDIIFVTYKKRLMECGIVVYFF